MCKQPNIFLAIYISNVAQKENGNAQDRFISEASFPFMVFSKIDVSNVRMRNFID